MMHDVYAGESAVRSVKKREKYLPRIDSEGPSCSKSGQYETRFKLAYFDNLLRPAVDDAVGMMQKNEPIIQIARDGSEPSDSMIRLRDYCTNHGDGIRGLKSRMNRNQVIFGRSGMLLDVVPGEDGTWGEFVIQEYSPENIVDGEEDADGRLQWILLDESTMVFDRDKKHWKPEPRYRILGISEAYYSCEISGNDVAAKWLAFNFDSPPENAVFPKYRNKTIDFIPFTVCNVDRLGIDQWQEPPYMSVASMTLNKYQTDSLYKLALARHASPTLVVSNAKSDGNIALGGMLCLQGGATASLLETSGSGLQEFRNAKNDTESSLKNIMLRNLLDGAGANSSAEAIEMRTTSGTFSVADIDRAGARAIEEQLIFAAAWSGMSMNEANESIQFKADTSYIGAKYSLQEITSFMLANESLRMFSREALYAAVREVAPFLPTYEDNIVQIENEGII